MAATLVCVLDTVGSDNNPGTSTTVDALGPPRIKFTTSDTHLVDNNNPIPKPSSGTKYSFWKSLHLKCTVAPSSQIDNLKWYTDGSGYGTGITLKAGTETPTKNSGSSTGYGLATGSVGDSGNEMIASHPDITGSSDAFGYTSGSPKSISISEAGAIINATNETSDYLVLQVEVISTAAVGEPASENGVWKWDEI